MQRGLGLGAVFILAGVGLGVEGVLDFLDVAP